MGGTSEPFFEKLLAEIDESEKSMNCVFELGKKGATINIELLERKGGTKQDLARIIIKFVNQMKKNSNVMRRAVSEIEKGREEARKGNIEVIKLQKELLECQSVQINKFQQSLDVQLKSHSDALSLIEEKLPHTIKTELKSYSDVVKKNASDSLTIRDITTAMQDVVKVVHDRDNVERDKNIIMFGLPEQSNENLQDRVADVLLSIDQKPRLTAVRFGKDLGKRPIKITFERPETVSTILKNAKHLKNSEEYADIYLSRDMPPEERENRRKLVEQMKNKMKKNPKTRYYIRGNEICCETETVKEEESDEGEEESDDEWMENLYIAPPRDY